MADKLHGGAKAGSVDLSIVVTLIKTSDNTKMTGIAHGALTAYYYRPGAAAAVAISLSALTNLNDAHADGGWKEISSANMPGLYRLDLPDAALAAGAEGVVIQVKHADGYFEQFLALEAVGAAEVYARLGAPAGASLAADLVTIDDFLDTEVAAIKAKTDNLPGSPAAVGSAMTLAADAVSAAALAADAVTEIQSGLATAAALDTVDNFLDTEVAAIKAKTDLIPAAPAAVGDIPTLAQITAALFIDRVLSSVRAGSTPTTTSVRGPDTLSSSDDRYNNQFLLFTSGDLAGGPPRKITDYDGSTRTFTVSALPAAPAAADTFQIIGLGAAS